VDAVTGHLKLMWFLYNIFQNEDLQSYKCFNKRILTIYIQASNEYEQMKQNFVYQFGMK
jgi:hypothetical protein